MSSSTRQCLSRRCGIADSYVDARGVSRRTSAGTRTAILAAMGFDASSEESATRALQELNRQEWAKALPPAIVHRTPGPPAVLVTVPAGTRRIVWSAEMEDGTRRRRRVDVKRLAVADRLTIDGVAYVRLRLVLSGDFPYGYHTLSVRGARMPLIVAPAKCWLPSKIAAGSRLWGVTAQLYLLRSRRDWGIGDFGDLRALIDIVKPHGADVIGVNPLHALFADDPEQASPYSPASRLLLNVLNIEVPPLARQLKSEKARRLMASNEFRRRLERCRDATHVSYGEVAALKSQVLRILFDASRSQRRSPAWRAYKKFERASSHAIKRACLFLALRGYFAAQAPELADWRHWPHEYRDPESQAVKAFAAEHADLVSFQVWLQHVADMQLGAAVEAAAPMAIGLYRDLAVGADPAGAETWANQHAVVAAAQVGAPPDIYNPPGQDWGLPPFNPQALREEGYRAFIDLVRANMRHAGGLRIDHVMALMQLYWVPRGMTPKDGTYVEYPIDDLVGILALESHRHECIVVGEDLGTVPAGFRERMTAANILSYRVLFFERDEQGFLAADRYPELALAVVSSHDLPTLRAWWQGSDLDLKEKLGLFPTPEDQRNARQQRVRDKAQLQQALRREGLADGALDADSLFAAAHAFLARTACALSTVQIDDITDETDPVNVPTTSDEHRNWRRRLSLTLEQIAKSPRLSQVSKALRAERRSRPAALPLAATRSEARAKREPPRWYC
jgi:4-alpha-glucanotransferase